MTCSVGINPGAKEKPNVESEAEVSIQAASKYSFTTAVESDSLVTLSSIVRPST